MPSGQRQLLFDLAAGLPGARILDRAADQLGRAGVGISRVERDLREELVFDPGTHELLGYQQVLVNPDAEYAAPGGAITGWTAYVSRQLRTALPERIPPLPGPPCDPPGSGRGTAIRPGLLLSTGYFTDLKTQLDQWLAAGVITEADRQALRPPK